MAFSVCKAAGTTRSIRVPDDARRTTNSKANQSAHGTFDGWHGPWPYAFRQITPIGQNDETPAGAKASSGLVPERRQVDRGGGQSEDPRPRAGWTLVQNPEHVAAQEPIGRDHAGLPSDLDQVAASFDADGIPPSVQQHAHFQASVRPEHQEAVAGRTAR
jgi:hypothetical protein